MNQINIEPLRKGEDGKFKGGYASKSLIGIEQGLITNINCTASEIPGQDVINQNCYCVTCGSTLTDTSCTKP